MKVQGLATILSFSILCFYIKVYGQINWSKYEANPVLTPGINNGVGPYGVDGSFDSRYALSPAVVFESGFYKMWYVGYEENYTGRFTIGFAVSENGVIWNTYTKNPTLTNGAPGTFDALHVWISIVHGEDGEYKMYYSGTNGSGWKVGLAKSNDGVDWTKESSNPILDVGASGSWDDADVWGVSIIQMGPNDYRMWYSGRTSDLRAKIGYATSSDGIQWEKYPGNPVLVSGSPGSWESQNVYVPRVVFVNSLFHMFYLGNEETGRTQIGYAHSSDGISWTKYNGNPVLRVGSAGEWDSYRLIDHGIILQQNTLKIWYGGLDKANTWQIGYATSELVTDIHNFSLLPQKFGLYQSYPNPSNPSVTIKYDVPKQARVTIAVFNALGQVVAALVDEEKSAGHYQVVWNTKNAASGAYWYRMIAGDFVEARNLLLIK